MLGIELQQSVLAVRTPRSIFEPLYERLVLKALGQMSQGALEIVLPDGRRIHQGDPASDVKASVRIRRPAFFKKCILYGDIGFGEAFVDGDWETDDLTGVIRWMILNVQNNPSMSGSKRNAVLLNLLQIGNRIAHLFRRNDPRGSRENIHAHYDLGNTFFETFLDPSMTYSSGIF